ncbi:hypothetical protein HanIR_Chr02g0061641 [Helianthus annuus]|nr:hypothetical protein HanIR_Chr02g0061641 [Helianthus annuus]
MDSPMEEGGSLWRHQIGVLGEFKRGLDVAHGDWFGVREGTHLLGEHPLHP